MCSHNCSEGIYENAAVINKMSNSPLEKYEFGNDQNNKNDDEVDDDEDEDVKNNEEDDSFDNQEGVSFQILKKLSFFIN